MANFNLSEKISELAIRKSSNLPQSLRFMFLRPATTYKFRGAVPPRLALPARFIQVGLKLR